MNVKTWKNNAIYTSYMQITFQIDFREMRCNSLTYATLINSLLFENSEFRLTNIFNFVI